MTVVLTLLIALGVGVYGVLTVRFRRRVREGDEEWRERWRALDPARRRAIGQTIRQGGAVSGTEDAELALRAVAQVEFVRRAMLPLNAAATLGVAAFLIAGLLTDENVLAVAGGVGVAVGLVFGLISRRQRRRLRRSAEATRQRSP